MIGEFGIAVLALRNQLTIAGSLGHREIESLFKRGLLFRDEERLR